MKGRIIAIVGLLAANVAFGATTCFARGAYVGVHAGVAFLDDIEIGRTNTEYDSGFAFGATAGYDFGKARVEGEVTIRRNDVDRIGNGSFGAASGDIEAVSVMANGYYDIETGTTVTPYVGGGIGFVGIAFNDIRSAGGGTLLDDDGVEIALQFAPGATFKLTDMVDLDLGYRLFYAPLTFENRLSGETRDDSYLSHNLTVGLRLNF